MAPSFSFSARQSSARRAAPTRRRSRGLAAALLAGMLILAVAAPAGAADVSAAGGFTDVEPASPHADAIAALAQAGVTSGCAAERFCPAQTVTRDQMATFITRALDLPAPSGTTGFTDVAAASAHAAGIASLEAAGISSGCGAGRFCPRDPVTRDQMATFLARAFSLPVSGVHAFADVAAASAHAAAVRALAASGVTSGCAENRYCPRATVTRGQMASFLTRAGQVEGPADGPALDTAPGGPDPAETGPFAADLAPTAPAPTPGPVDTTCAGVPVTSTVDIQELIEASPAGTSFCFAPGLYRLPRSLVAKPGNTFTGAVGTVLNGSKVLDTFQRDGAHWVAQGQTQEFYEHGECIPGYSGCRRAEEVYVDDQPLWQVTSRAELAPGSFYFDYATDRIYLADDPTGRTVETTVSQNAFAGKQWSWEREADNVTVRNFVIEKFASQAQQGAVSAFTSTGWTVEDNELRLNHGLGVHVNSGGVVRDNHVHGNGQLGLGAAGTDVLVEGNEVSHNNRAGFTDWWEAGGMKFALTDGLVVRGNYIHHNDGPGIWTDIDNIRTLMEDNVIMKNQNAGIFHEISYAATVRHNLIAHNGLAGNAWAYGAGIQIAHSPDVEVYGNVVRGNFNGITVIMQDRGEGAYGPWEPRNVTVHSNVIEMSSGFSGAVQDIGDKSLFTSRDIVFQDNRYTVSGDGLNFAWDDRLVTPDEWRNFGNDLHGQFDGWQG